MRSFNGCMKLPWTDIAQTEMTNQSLVLELGEHGEGFLDRFIGGRHDSANTQIDDIQRVQAEVSQVVMDLRPSVPGAKERESRICPLPGGRLPW
jgi:hypothetical protein